MSNKYYVYLHYTADTHKLFYIGKGVVGSSRKTSSSGRNIYWKRVVQKHSFYVKEYANDLDEKLAFDIESYLIKTIGRTNLTNLTDGGEGASGLLQSDAKREKLSKAHTGKKHTEAAKLKMSQSQKGRKLSEETKNKLSLLRKNKPLSDAHKKLLKENSARKGKPGVNRKAVVCVDTGDIYESATAAAKAFGKSTSSLISANCLKQCKTAYGFTFEYIQPLPEFEE